MVRLGGLSAEIPSRTAFKQPTILRLLLPSASSEPPYRTWRELVRLDAWPRFMRNLPRHERKGNTMAASSRLMITVAERRFPVRIRIAMPAGGFGERLNRMQSWLDQNAGADGWAMTPSGIRGVVNDAVAVHFADVAIASAFVARWCQAHRVEIADGLFRVREDEPAQRIGTGHHKTP
jgi:hypothetical protein